MESPRFSCRATILLLVYIYNIINGIQGTLGESSCQLFTADTLIYCSDIPLAFAENELQYLITP